MVQIMASVLLPCPVYSRWARRGFESCWAQHRCKQNSGPDGPSPVWGEHSLLPSVTSTSHWKALPVLSVSSSVTNNNSPYTSQSCCKQFSIARHLKRQPLPTCVRLSLFLFTSSRACYKYCSFLCVQRWEKSRQPLHTNQTEPASMPSHTVSGTITQWMWSSVRKKLRGLHKKVFLKTQEVGSHWEIHS